MEPILAQIATSQWPHLFAVSAGAVGLFACGAVVWAHRLTSRDRSAIKNAETMLASAEVWRGAHATSEHELSKWLRERKIDLESGVADVIRACWSAWLGSRATTLTEIHVLVARRERSRTPARFSAGVAGLLLVIGIVGTLWSVKPILKAFRFRISTPEGMMPALDEPALSNVAESTELVNSLMHSLGDAFLPSLVALIFTIVVVFFRGTYSLCLHRYMLELDRFAMGTVMPQYRPRSIADEYEGVRATFGTLAKAIGEREAKFEGVVAQLTEFVDRLEPTLNGLDAGVAKMATAADALASRSSSIATTLTRTLGKKSPLYAAVNGFEGIFARTNEELERLSNLIDGITRNQDQAREQMMAALDELAKAVETIGQDHKENSQAVASAIREVISIVSGLPERAIEAARAMLKDGLDVMRTSLASLLSDQKSEIAVTQKDLRDQTTETLESIKKTLVETGNRITESTSAIPETLRKIDDSLSRQSETQQAAVDAIRSLAAEAESEIRNTGVSLMTPLNPPAAPTQIHSGLPPEPDTTWAPSSEANNGSAPHEVGEFNPPEKSNGFLSRLFGGS